MPFLHSPAVLRRNVPAGHGYPTLLEDTQPPKQGPHLRSTRSIAKLIDLVRNPIENVGEAVENWYEGSTRAERARQQKRDEARQIWYLRLGNVGAPGQTPRESPHRSADMADRRPPTRIGRRPRPSWTTLKAIIGGSPSLNRPTMTPPWSKLDSSSSTKRASVATSDACCFSSVPR